MNIFRTFTENNPKSNPKSFSVNIQGTLECPLFKAKDIGNGLDMDVQEITMDFDEDEIHISTSAGEDAPIFLTELGISRFLGMSHNPLTRPFQKWLLSTINGLRSTARVASEQALAESEQARLQAEQARLQAEKKAVALKAQLANKYVPGQQLYVLMNPADSDRQLYKLGRTKDLSKRMVSYGTSMPDKCTVLHSVECLDSSVCEKIVGRALEPYRYRSEWYQCDLSIITHAMNAAVMAHDGIVCAMPHLAKYNVVSKLNAIFEEIEQNEGMRVVKRARSKSPLPVESVTPEVCGASSSAPVNQDMVVDVEKDNVDVDAEKVDNEEDDHYPLKAWLTKYYTITGRGIDHWSKKALYDHYHRTWYYLRDGPKMTKQIFNGELGGFLRAGRIMHADDTLDVFFGIRRNRIPDESLQEKVALWMSEHLVYTKNEKDYVRKVDLYKHFRDHLTGTGAKVMKESDFVISLQGIIGTRSELLPRKKFNGKYEYSVWLGWTWEHMIEK